MKTLKYEMNFEINDYFDLLHRFFFRTLIFFVFSRRHFGNLTNTWHTAA